MRAGAFTRLWEKSRAAAWVVGQIGQLYATEKALREHRLPEPNRAAVRALAKPAFGNAGTLAPGFGNHPPPGLAEESFCCSQAIDYTLSRWEALTRYLDDGRLEIDNNLCENAIRPTAIGKNYVKLSVMQRWRQDSIKGCEIERLDCR